MAFASFLKVCDAFATAFAPRKQVAALVGTDGTDVPSSPYRSAGQAEVDLFALQVEDYLIRCNLRCLLRLFCRRVIVEMLGGDDNEEKQACRNDEKRNFCHQVLL